MVDEEARWGVAARAVVDGLIWEGRTFPESVGFGIHTPQSATAIVDSCYSGSEECILLSLPRQNDIVFYYVRFWFKMYYNLRHCLETLLWILFFFLNWLLTPIKSV